MKKINIGIVGDWFVTYAGSEKGCCRIYRLVSRC